MRALVLLLWLPQAAASGGAIRGTVTDAATGMPLAGFRIQVARTVAGAGPLLRLSSSEESAVTGDDGRYSLTGVNPGKLIVTAGRGTGPSTERTLELRDGQDVTLDFVLPANPTISGRVLDEERHPVSGATVWLIQSDYLPGVLRRTRVSPEDSKGDGSFAFDSLEAGRTYYLLVDCDHPVNAAGAEPAPVDQREPIEASTYYGDVTSIDAATPVVLQPGERRDHADIRIRKAIPYCVDGQVQGTGKILVPYVSIQQAAIADASRVLLYSSRTESTFRLCGLPPNDYVAFAALGAQRGSARFTIANADAHHITLDLNPVDVYLDSSWEGDPPPEEAAAPSARPERDAMLLRALGAVTGPVVSISLTAVDGAIGASRHERAPFTSLRISSLSPGDYLLNTHVAQGAYVKRTTYNGIPVADGVVHLSGGVNGTLQVVAAQGGGTIDCKVTDDADRPLPDTIVVVVPEGVSSAARLAAVAQRGTTDESGAFRSLTQAPGKYRVMALTSKYRNIPDDIDKLLAALPRAETVEVSDRGEAQVKLHPVSIE